MFAQGFISSRIVIGEIQLVFCLDEERSHLIVSLLVVPNELCLLDTMKIVEDWNIEQNCALLYLVILIDVKLFLLKRLNTYEPTKFDFTIL